MKLKAGQYILIGLPILIGGFLIYKQFRKPKVKPSVTPSNEDNDIIIGGGGNSGGSRNDTFPLKKGSYGNNVRRLQTALKKINPSALPKYGVDGDFGSETEAALKNQTGKTTCTSEELVRLELLGAKATGSWFPPMADPDAQQPKPLFGF